MTAFVHTHFCVFNEFFSVILIRTFGSDCQGCTGTQRDIFFQTAVLHMLSAGQPHKLERNVPSALALHLIAHIPWTKRCLQPTCPLHPLLRSAAAA